MLKHVFTIVFPLFLLVSFSGQLIALENRENSERAKITFKCVHCQKEKDLSERVSVVLISTIPSRGVSICSECDSLPKCERHKIPGVGTSRCNMPASTEINGIPVCQYCALVVPVTSNKDAQKIAEEVCRQLAADFKMNFRSKPQVELVSKKKMESFISIKEVAGCYLGVEGGKYRILVLENEPYFIYRSILAHELGHAWYEENGFRLVGEGKDPNCEGFAQFVAWCYLESFESTPSAGAGTFYSSFLKERVSLEKKQSFEQHDNKIYREGFRNVKAAMGDARTASEWKDIMQKIIKKGVCSYCGSLAETKTAGDDLLCRECSRDTIKDNAEADKVLKDIRRVLASKYKMETEHPVTCATGLRKVLKLDSDGNELGCWAKPERNKTQYTIRILTGLPREIFRAAGAHQLAHDWMDENLPHLMDEPEIREGFAEYVAWSLSKAEDSKLAMNYVERKTDNVYGRGFRTVRRLMDKAKAKTASEWKMVLLKQYPAPIAAPSDGASAKSGARSPDSAKKTNKKSNK